MGRFDPVWAFLEGVIVAETEKAIGIGDSDLSDVDFWLPKSQIDGITYAEGGDERGCVVRKGEAVEAVRIPQWLADENRLDWEV